MINLYRIPLNLLIALNVLFQEKNVTRAAEKLCLSQATMSNNLFQLRKMFSDELLTREKNKMVLTPFGETIQPTLQRIIFEISQLLASKEKFDIVDCDRTFKIGLSDKWASFLMPKLIPVLQAHAPKIQINIAPLVEVYDSDPFEKMHCDFTLARSAKLPDLIQRHLLLDDEFVCLVSKHHPLANKKKIEAIDYFAYQHIAFRMYNSNFLSSVDQYLAEQGISGRNIILHTPYLDVLFHMIEQSDNLIGTITRSSAALFAEKYACVSIPIAMKMPVLKFYLAWNKNHAFDPAHRWMRDQIMRIFS